MADQTSRPNLQHFMDFISIYPDEQTATDALMDRDKYQAQIAGAEIAVAFEGALKIFHQKSLIKTEN